MNTMLGEHNTANLSEGEWRWMRKHSAFSTLSREVRLWKLSDSNSQTLIKAVPVIENLLNCHIREWEKIGNLKEWYSLLENFSFDVGSYFLWGDPSYSTERKKSMHHDFELMGEGTSLYNWIKLLAMMTAPINIPGTSWYKGIQARKRMVASTSKLLLEISQSGDFSDKGILGSWLSNLTKGFLLCIIILLEEVFDKKVTDMFIGLLFAGFNF